MKKIEENILTFIQKNVIPIGFIAVTLMSILIRLSLFDHETADYSFFMQSWLNELKSYPGFSGLGAAIGDYNVPYMVVLSIVSKLPLFDLYEIKALSAIFEYLGAFAAILILSHIGKTKIITERNLFAYSVIILTPVVFLDSAYWAQCDFIYTSMLLLCTYFMMKEKFSPAMIFFGIGLAFKLQTIFFLPVIIIYYFASKKMSILHVLWIPAVFFVMDLPAIFAGRGLVETLSIYKNQTTTYEMLTLSCPNFFVFFTGDYQLLSRMGILVTMTLLGLGACFIIKRGINDKRELILLAVWCNMICIYFLPAMHERYVFAACIFSIVWAFICKKDWWIAFGINFVCFLSYLFYLVHDDIISLKYLAIANLVIIAALTIRLFVKRIPQQETAGSV